MSRLRGLYLVTPEWDDSARLIDAARCALRPGVALLQYRDKSQNPEKRRHEAQAMLALCRRAGVPFVVNDDLALALEVGADGVHLGRDDGPVDAARAALGAGRILGVSCYDDLSQAKAAVAEGADYVAFGAVYPSPTKPQAIHAPHAVLGAARTLGVPVAAIGGITAENGGAVVAAGADLLAVVSDVFMAANITARVAAYRSLFDAVR